MLRFSLVRYEFSHIVGERVIVSVGLEVGANVGTVGALVGTLVGEEDVGDTEGLLVGLSVGFIVGTSVGDLVVGMPVGFLVHTQSSARWTPTKTKVKRATETGRSAKTNVSRCNKPPTKLTLPTRSRTPRL